MRKRKHTRIKDYDYSQAGYYYITICTQGKLPRLANIKVGRGLAPAAAELTPKGKVIEEQLLVLPHRYPYVKIDKYVIMPTHIHAILVLTAETAGANPRPTLMDIVCTFKSISARLCNQHSHVKSRKIWQSSFYDEVIRNETAYRDIWEYIDTNPQKWNEDIYFCDSSPD